MTYFDRAACRFDAQVAGDPNKAIGRLIDNRKKDGAFILAPLLYPFAVFSKGNKWPIGKISPACSCLFKLNGSIKRLCMLLRVERFETSEAPFDNLRFRPGWRNPIGKQGTDGLM